MEPYLDGVILAPGEEVEAALEYLTEAQQIDTNPHLIAALGKLAAPGPEGVMLDHHETRAVFNVLVYTMYDQFVSRQSIEVATRLAKAHFGEDFERGASLSMRALAAEVAPMPSRRQQA